MPYEDVDNLQSIIDEEVLLFFLKDTINCEEQILCVFCMLYSAMRAICPETCIKMIDEKS